MESPGTSVGDVRSDIAAIRAKMRDIQMRTNDQIRNEDFKTPEPTPPPPGLASTAVTPRGTTASNVFTVGRKQSELIALDLKSPVVAPHLPPALQHHNSAATDENIKIAMMEDFGLELDNSSALDFTQSIGGDPADFGLTSPARVAAEEDELEERVCVNYKDPRWSRVKMDLGEADELLMRSAADREAMRTAANASADAVPDEKPKEAPEPKQPSEYLGMSDEGRLVPIELRKLSNIAIIERICVMSGPSRSIARAFYTAFGEDFGDKLTLMQFKTFMRDTGLFDRGVSMASCTIMFTSLTKPASVMGAGAFALAMFFIGAMLKKRTEEDDYDALEIFCDTILNPYVKQFLPKWADPETDFAKEDGELQQKLWAYAPAFLDLFTLSETDPMARARGGGAAQAAQQNGKGGSTERPQTAGGSMLKAPQKPKGDGAASGRGLGSAMRKAIMSQATAARKPVPPADSVAATEAEFKRLLKVFPTYVKPEDHTYFSRGCHYRTFMKLHMVNRFVNYLGLASVTHTEVVRAARAASAIYREHPFRCRHAAAMLDVDGVILLFPEFIDCMVRLATIEYPLPGTSLACPTAINTGLSMVRESSMMYRKQSVTSPKSRKGSVAGGATPGIRSPEAASRRNTRTEFDTSKRRSTAAVPLTCRAPSECFQALIDFHLNEVFFSTFRTPVGNRMDETAGFVQRSQKPTPQLPFSSGRKPKELPQPARDARMAPPAIVKVFMRDTEKRSIFALDTTIRRNDVDAGQLIVIGRDGGELVLHGRCLNNRTGAFLLFNNRISMRCVQINEEKGSAVCTAPPLRLVLHRISEDAKDEDYQAFFGPNMSDDKLAPWRRSTNYQSADQSGGPVPRRLVYCVQDGVNTIRVCSLLRYLIPIRFSGDAVNWTDRLDLSHDEQQEIHRRGHFGAKGRHSGTQKGPAGAPGSSGDIPEGHSILAVYEQRLPINPIPEPLLVALRSIFDSYVKYGRSFAVNYLDSGRWRHFCREYFDVHGWDDESTAVTPAEFTASSRLVFDPDDDGDSMPPTLDDVEADDEEGGSWITQAPQVRVTHIRRAFGIHSIAVESQRGKMDGLTFERFVGATLELIVNERMGIKALPTQLAMAPAVWWDTLARAIKRDMRRRAKAGPPRWQEFLEETPESVLASTISPRKNQPVETLSVPDSAEGRDFFFGVEHAEHTLVAGDDHSTTFTKSGGYLLAARDCKCEHRVFDIYSGPTCVGTLSSRPGEVVLQRCDDEKPQVSSNEHISFVQHSPIGDPEVLRILSVPHGFLPTMRRLINKGYYPFATNRGATLNGHPVRGTSLHRFTRHTVCKSKVTTIERKTQPTALESRVEGSGRLDGTVATRVWEVRKDYKETVAVLTNIPGQLAALEWSPTAHMFESPVASMTLLKAVPGDGQFTQLAEIFVNSTRLTEIRERIEGLKYGLQLVFPQ